MNDFEYGNNGGQNYGGQNSGGQNSGWQNNGGQNSGGQNSGWQNNGGQNYGGQSSGWQNNGGQNYGGQNSGWQNNGGRYSVQSPYGINNKQNKEKNRAAQINLLCITTVFGMGFSLYPLLSQLYIKIISGSDVLLQLYRNNNDIRNLCEMLYSFMCVGLPFLLAYVLFKKTGIEHFNLPLGKPRGKNTLLLIFAGLGFCFVGSLVSSYIATYAQAVGIEFYSYEDAIKGAAAPDSVLGCVLLLLHSAVTPALVEEFAFRGVLLQSLRKYGDWFAIIVSAVLFGFMHANFTQVPFAIFAGLALGFATVVTGSMWTGIIIHFLNNFVSVMYTIVVMNFDEGAGWVFSTAVTYGFILLGIIAIAVYLSKMHGRGFRLYKGSKGATPKKAALVFLSPVVLAGEIYLLLTMLTDIKGFSLLFWK